MKGINVKKLAAIATGAALLGSAVAPIVMAASVQKSDVYNDDGTPRGNIVVGSQAALSDAIWAGNLAAKIAEKATTTKEVEVKAGTGEDAKASGNLDLADLTVDVSVGGTVKFGAGSKTYNVTLNSGSAAGDVEVLTAMDTSDANALTTQLLHLVNKSINMKVNNGDVSNQTSSESVKEMIGLDADAKFDATSTSIKDLVAKIGQGKFSYKTNIGASTKGIDLGSTSFTDGGDDSVKVVFFGEEYELNSATLSGTKNVKLVKASAKETLTEGQEIEDLDGDNKYKGKKVKVKFKQISATSATATYQGTFELFDDEGNLIDTRTVTAGSNLRDEFKDSASNEALRTNLFVDTIANAATTNIGYAEITKGTDTILIYDGKEYPYDSTKSSSTKRYQAIITAADTNGLYSIEIRNSAEQWSSPSTDGYDFGPLYPTDSTQSLTGKTGKEAVFMQGAADGTLGKGYASVEFVGFENKQNKTPVVMGRITGLPAGTNGGITFRGENDATRTVPFYYKLADTNTGGSFDFEGKTVWYSMRFATGTGGKDTAADYNIVVRSSDYVNGRQWTFATTGGYGGDGGLFSITVGGDKVVSDVNDAETFTVDGVTYTVRDANTGANANHTMGINVDAVVEFRLNNDTGTLLYNTAGDTTDASYGLMGLTGDITFDGNGTGVSGTNNGMVTMGLYTQDSARPVFYAGKYNTTTDKLFLLLDADYFGAGQSNLLKDSHKVGFLGTSIPADDGTYTEADAFSGSWGNSFATDANTGSQIQKNGAAWVYGHYVPKDTDFNASGQNGGVYTSSNAYFVAEFTVEDAASTGGDFNAYIDTATGGNIGPFGGTSSTNLSGYSYDARFRGANSFNLTSGSDISYLQAGYSDSGAKVSLLSNDSGIQFSLPQSAEKVNVVVKGKATTRTVESGESITGLKEGETGTTATGTKITIAKVTGGACKVDVKKGAGAICTAEPDKFKMQAGVKNPIVYVDSDNVSGTNIVVGGHIVNKLAAKLANSLTAPGQKVVEVDTASGNIYVAGYTAADTAAAVKDLIDTIDAFD